MAEIFTGQVIGMYPADRKLLRRLNGLVPAELRFTPSIEHSLTTCDGCKQDCWIGPNQLQLATCALMKISKLCHPCVAEVHNILDMDPHAVMTNVDERLIPRRT